MTVMLLEWVFTSVFLILVVLALRAALGKRVSAHLRYALWAVVLVRLLVPVQLFTSPIAGTWVFFESRTEQDVMDWPSAPTVPSNDSGGNTLALGGQGSPVANTIAVPEFPDPPAVPDAPEPPEAPDLTRAPAWLGWIWLAGSAAAALVFLLSNLRFYWKLRRERIPLEGADCPLRVYAAVNLPSPCLFGIIRPAVYVTPEAAADPAMLHHVLAHEYTHYCHRDHIWSLLRCGALAAHWWNPLVWLAAVLSQRDAELACDEGALKRLGDGERVGYGSTLLALVTAKPRPADLFRCATTMAGDKKSLKERITRIAQAPKRWLWAAVAAVLVTALACVCAFGQAEPVEPEEDVNGKTELSFSINDHGLVDITGTVLGMTLEPGTYWQATGSPARSLSMPYEPFTDGIKGYMTAWWETPTSVSVTTYMMAVPSSSAFAGYWNFTVDLSGEEAIVTRMVAQAGLETPEGAEVRMYPETISDEEAIRAARIAAKLMTEAEDYYRENAEAALSSAPGESGPPAVENGVFLKDYSLEAWTDAPVLSDGTDLNRDGVKETIKVLDILGEYLEGVQPSGHYVGVFQGDELLWMDEAFYAHVGYNALFLCTLDGEDYLLRYNPYMSTGSAGYSYKLFTLENGQETVVGEKSVEFDINFGQLMHQSFDPEAIAAFMDEINSLLAHSVQLINTDSGLLDTFEKEGRLCDSLGWLDSGELALSVDRSKSLLENLRAYQAAMENQWYAENPTIDCVNAEEINADIWLSYQGKNTRFTADCWEYRYQPAEQVKPEVLDLNGDGRDEIVFSLIWGHGTGCVIEKLYVFDADTLEQYDTSGLNEMILSAIQSTGDEDNFYLSGAGLDVTISKSEAGEVNPDAPITNRLGFGDIILYTIWKNGEEVICVLGCDASGADINYIGYINIPIRMTSSGDFVCGQAQYTAGNPF